MRTTKVLAILVLALSLMVCMARVSNAAPMSTAWTYQGRLLEESQPADGLYDFQFKLFDDPCTGIQKGGTIDINDLDVIDGYFTVELDFGSDVFNGEARWLETTVMHADGSDPCKLRPRQEMTPVPYALQTRGIFTDNTGNVGIGTTSPQSHVQIDNSIDATGSGASNLALLVRRNSIAAGSGPGIGFCSDNSLAVGAKIVHIRTSSNSKGDLAFYTKSATSGPSTEKMRLKDNGNVGIGTTSPVDKLHIQAGNLQGLTMEGSGGNVLLRLKENSPGGKNYLLGSSGGASGLGQGVFTIRDFTTDVVRLRIESNGDTALGGSFGASASSSISGAHIVTKGGNVGIGTTSPQSHVQIDNSLDATGSGASNLALLVRRNSIAAGSGPGIGFCSDNSLAVGAKIVHIRTSSNSKGDLAFYTKSATSGFSTEKMRIKDNGNVGIGTTVPIAKLHVEGGLRVSADGDFLGSFLRTSGNLIANGEIYKQGVDPVYINDDLDVNGKIYQRGTQIHADYVFEPNYKLESIDEHSEYMWANMHLKAIPKARLDENGQEIVEAGAHRRGIVEELEKAHIYIEQLHERIKMMEEKMAKLEAVVCTVQ